MQKFCSVLCLALLVSRVDGAEPTWVYTVQISATVESAPPRITLSWPPDQFGANSYTVYRKAKEDTSWGAGTVLSGTASYYVDDAVNVGSTYEYQIVKASTQGYKGYGYIYSGIEAPLIEQRGKLILVVADTHAASLSNELFRLQTDLVGDGWEVIRHDVATTDTPASVRGLIANDYFADPPNVKAVFLFGHVPILQSGNLNYDGHLARPMPADAFYGDVDGNWNGSPNFLPSDVELMVGRVDLFDMPGNGSAVPWPSEVELLRNYLNKDHNWRHGGIAVPRRALMGDRRGVENGEATASSGYRNFEPLVGPGNTVQANTEDNSPLGERWITLATGGEYLWSYGCGGGLPTGVSQLGDHGQYHDLWSLDIVNQDARAVFVMFFGSWFANWDGTDNFLRSVLATPTMGLACFMAGRPHWFCHHMGLGETIGYSTRLSMNNSTLYRNQSNVFTRAIYISLMGDPTLRMDPVVPPSNLSPSPSAGITLNWTGSPDAVAGYYVYRSDDVLGPFTRVSDSLVVGTSFTDSTALVNHDYTYMVRAVKLETVPSGTYVNASQGVFATIHVELTLIRVSARPTANGLLLEWNGQPGKIYLVEAKNSLEETDWTVWGGVVAAGPDVSWEDTSVGSSTQRFYRVRSQ